MKIDRGNDGRGGLLRNQIEDIPLRNPIIVIARMSHAPAAGHGRGGKGRGALQTLQDDVVDGARREVGDCRNQQEVKCDNVSLRQSKLHYNIASESYELPCTSRFTS